MKGKTGGLTIKEFVGLKPKIYSYLVDDNSAHNEAKGVNKNVVAKIAHNEYKDVLLNKNVWYIQWIGFKVKIIKQKLIKSTRYLSCFDDKMYIQNKGYDGLALGYQSQL